jgi:4-hydroxy-tetrahydrodipicolinate synthase
MKYTKAESREWARATLHGCCNVIIPSYTHDLRHINEHAIRHDVRRDIELGFLGALTVSETSLTLDEYIQFVEWASDEADGRLLLVHHASFNTLEENIEAAQRAEKAGADLMLLAYPPSFYPMSDDDIYEYTAALCNATNLAVIVFPVPLWGFERISPASMSMNLLGRLIDACPNIAVIKAEGGMPSIGGFIDCWNRFSDRVLVTMPLEHDGIPLSTILPVQVLATSNYEYMGDSVPRMLELARAGKANQAMELYWQVYPARKANESATALGTANAVHRMAWKYEAWLNGFNGGPLRMPTNRLVYTQMRTLRGALEASKLPCTSDPDEAFFVGRCPA